MLQIRILHVDLSNNYSKQVSIHGIASDAAIHAAVLRGHMHLQGVRQPAENIFFSLIIADELGAFQVAADVLFQ